jgi:hypothetical protein
MSLPRPAPSRRSRCSEDASSLGPSSRRGLRPVEVRANRKLCTKQSDTCDAERIRARRYHSHRLWRLLNELARQCPRPVKPREQAGDRDRSRAAVTRSNASLTIATSGGQRHPEARGPGFEQRQSRRIGPPPVGRTRTRPIGLALRSSSRSSVRRQDRGLHVSAGRACRPRDSLRRAAHPMILRKPLGLFSFLAPTRRRRAGRLEQRTEFGLG